MGLINSNRNSEIKCWTYGKVGNFKRDCKEGRKKNKKENDSKDEFENYSRDEGGDAFVVALENFVPCPILREDFPHVVFPLSSLFWT